MSAEMRCRKHPSYKALRQPTGDCGTCASIWALVQQLRNSKCDYVLRFFSRVNRSK
jgi:hypothetical protein